jgi:putative PEP-CTERM system TPR-repeat lipoprotein
MPIRSRRLARTLASRALVLCLLVSGTACGLAVDDEVRVERAQEALDNGDYRAAIIDLRNVLQNDPDNRAARVMLGRAAIRAGDPATAEKEFRRALELGEPLGNIAGDLGRAMLELGHFNELLEELRPESAAEEADKLEILMLRADATMGLQLPESARDIYLEILESAPSDMPAKLGVASTYAAQEEYALARETLEEALEADPAYAAAWLASGSLHLAVRDARSAVADFEKALELSAAEEAEETRVSALIGLAEAHLANRDLPAAKEAVSDLRALVPEDLRATYLAARVAFLEEDFETAQTLLAEILSAAPEYRPAQFLMGAVHLQRGSLGQAEMHLSAVVAAAPDNIDARRLLAETRLRQDRAEEAAEILQPVLNSGDPDIAALSLAVRANLAAGQYDNAIAYLKQSVEENPDDPDRQLDLAAAYLAAGRVPEAEELIRSIPEETGEAGYRRDLLSVMAPLQRGDETAAQAAAESMAERWPEDARIRNLHGGIAFSLGRNQQARESFLAARAIAPDDPATLVDLARLDTREGDFDAARERYLKVLERDPDAVGVMVALARLEARAENRTAVVEWLEKARQTDAAAALPRRLLAQEYLMRREYEAARALASEAVSLDESNAEAHNLLGLARQGLGDNEAAAASFGRAADLESGETGYRLNEARAQMLSGDARLAEESIRAAGGEDLDNIPAAAMLAMAKARQGDTGAALGIARELQERHPENGLPHALEGELLADQEDYAAAAAAYDKALALRQDDRRLALRAYRLRTLGDLASPEEPLLGYLSRRPLDTEIRLLVAQQSRVAGDNTVAIREYEQVVDAEPENFVALNNLAWEYFAQGDGRAEEVARRAFELAPDNDAVADTLGWILVNTGNLEEGIAMLRQAVDLGGSRPQIRYHLAAALARSGETSEARAILQELLANDEEFAGRPAAEELMATL